MFWNCQKFQNFWKISFPSLFCVVWYFQSLTFNCSIFPSLFRHFIFGSRIVRFPFLIPQYCYVVVKLCLRVPFLNPHCFYVVGKLCLCFPFLIPHYFYVVLIFNVNYFWDSGIPQKIHRKSSAHSLRCFWTNCVSSQKLLNSVAVLSKKSDFFLKKLLILGSCFWSPVSLQQPKFQSRFSEKI